MSAGIVNFGGNLTAQGKLLRANGNMQSLLNSDFDDIGNAFYVALPMQVTAIAWNKSSTAVEQLFVNCGAIYGIHISGRVGVVEPAFPMLLNPGNELLVHLPWSTGQIQVTLYT